MKIRLHIVVLVGIALVCLCGPLLAQVPDSSHSGISHNGSNVLLIFRFWLPVLFLLILVVGVIVAGIKAILNQIETYRQLKVYRKRLESLDESEKAILRHFLMSEGKCVSLNPSDETVDILFLKRILVRVDGMDSELRFGRAYPTWAVLASVKGWIIRRKKHLEAGEFIDHFDTVGKTVYEPPDWDPTGIDPGTYAIQPWAWDTLRKRPELLEESKPSDPLPSLRERA